MDYPFLSHSALRVYLIVHWIWWVCRKRKLVTSENIIPAAAGTALDIGLKFTPAGVDKTVRGIAKLILIATRIDRDVFNACNL